jgi:hypothetical protein
MNETEMDEKPAAVDKRRLLADIERLWLLGLPNQEIADELGEDRRVIGRNLRELKKRWARAAARQRAALSQTQCAAVFREAMQGWFRSQQPKLTTTEQTNSEDENVKKTTRRAEGPGDKTFLLAAVAALKALRQFDAAPEAKNRDVGDAVYLAILQLLTPEQVDNLNHEQLQRIRSAVDGLQTKVEAHRRQAAGRPEDPAGLHPAHQAGLPPELAPPDAGGDAGPGGGGPMPAIDGHVTTILQNPPVGRVKSVFFHKGGRLVSTGFDPTATPAKHCQSRSMGP